MPEQTRARAGTSKRFRRSSPTPAAEPEPQRDIADFRELLTNGVLVPLHLVMLTGERIQEVLDDAVNRGRMTRDDANDIVQGLLRRGRAETEDVLADLDRLLSRARVAPRRVAESAMAQAERARGIDRGFPIAGYDDLNVGQVQTRLGALSRADLRKVRDYEKRNAKRKSVLGTLEKKLA